MTLWLCTAGAIGLIVAPVIALARPPTFIHRSLLVAAALAFLGLFVQAALWGTFTLVDALGAMRRRRRAFWDAVAAWKARDPFADEDFLLDCRVPPDDLGRRVALAARAVLANQAGGVPPESIRADDALAEPLWAGVWWQDVFFHTEVEADAKVGNWSFRPALGDRVRDFVHFATSRARPFPPARRRRPS